MLKFDPITLADWKNRNIKTISIEFIASGCEGTSIAVRENLIQPGYSFMEVSSSGITAYCDSESKLTLEDAYITHTGTKWIMKSESVLTRCGCGKSFGIVTGDSKIDKIRLLKSKLAKSKRVSH